MLNFSLGLSFFVVAPVLPLIQDDYSVNRSLASLLVVVVLLSQAVFCILGAMLVVRLGLRRVITLGWFLASAPVLTLFIDNFTLLLLLRTVYGVGFALLIPALGPLTMQWFRPRELPLINSLGLAVATLAVSLSTFSAAPLAGLLGWRMVLSIFSLVTLLGAFTWVILGRTRDTKYSEQVKLSLRDLWGIMRFRYTILIALADLGPFAQYVALTSWLPTYYHEELGMTLAQAGFRVGLLPMAGLIALVAAGICAIRIERRKPFLIIPGIFVGFAGAASFTVGDSAILFPVLIALGICSWVYIPFLFTIPMELPGMSSQRLALMMGTIITIGSIGSVVSPAVVGMSADNLGTYWPGMAIWAILSLSLLLCGILLPETGRGNRVRVNNDES